MKRIKLNEENFFHFLTVLIHCPTVGRYMLSKQPPITSLSPTLTTSTIDLNAEQTPPSGHSNSPMYGRNWLQLSQKTDMLLMKASTLLPDLLTPAVVASNLTGHSKAFQSWRCLLEVTKTQEPKTHINNHTILLTSPSLMKANDCCCIRGNWGR